MPELAIPGVDRRRLLRRYALLAGALGAAVGLTGAWFVRWGEQTRALAAASAVQLSLPRSAIIGGGVGLMAAAALWLAAMALLARSREPG